MILIILCAAAILTADVFLAIQLAGSGKVRSILGGVAFELEEGYRDRRLKHEVRKYLRPVGGDMSLVEKVELFLIDKSNIRRYLPFINFYTFALIIAIIFTVTFKPIQETFSFIPTTIIICTIFSAAPVFGLDLMAKYNSEKVRRSLAEFISVLSRWCSVKNDIFYAFSKSVDSGLGEPLRTFVSDMVIQVNRGIAPVEALEILQVKVDNSQFRDFIINVKQNIRYRGDIRKLLSNLEEQFYKIEEEYARRRISTYKDRLLIYFVMFSVLFIGYGFLKMNPQVEEYYFRTFEGKSLLSFFSLLYIAGLYLTSGITRFRN